MAEAPQNDPYDSPGSGEDRTLDKHSVAHVLRKAREKHGQDLRRVAQALRIRYVYLEAIERGDFDKLPGPAYAVGFVRTYAEFLGLNGEKTVDAFKREVAGLKSQTQLHFLTPAPESKIPGGAVFLVCAIIAAIAYGTWYYLSNKDASVSDLIPGLPERLQNLLGDGEETADPVPETPAVDEDPVSEDTASTPSVAEEFTPEEVESAEALASETFDETVPPVDVEETPEVAGITTAPLDPLPEATTTDPVEPATEAPAAAAPSTPEPVVPEPAAAAPEPDASVPEVEDLPESETAEVAEDLPTAPVEAPTAPVEPATEAESETETLAAASDATEAEIPAAPEAEQPPALVDGRQPQIFGETNSDARIILRATQDCWIQVKDGDGALLLTRVLRNGDTYRVPNQSGLTLLTGNAGGLVVEVDGRALPSLGPVGAVRRNVPLDPDGLLSGTALAQ